MERRYQVFVSSTFKDLEEARKEVSSALLKSDCFPAGMELFPAADLEQFEYIKEVITESDYFIVVSAGKYGSRHHDTGVSYTEMEYDYAVEIGKPIIRLLHRNPFEILQGVAIEQTDEGKQRLRAFREKLSKSRMVNYWEDAKELGQQTTLALLDIKKRKPSAGWVRGENAITVDILKELEACRAKKTHAHPSIAEGPINFDDLPQKETTVPILVASANDDSSGQDAGKGKIKNRDIAEAIFLSLISNTDVENIGKAASDILTSSYEFSESQLDHDHVWLELKYDTIEHFLHYLEARGLVSGRNSPYIDKWQLTQSGRRNATYISARRHLG